MFLRNTGMGAMLATAHDSNKNIGDRMNTWGRRVSALAVLGIVAAGGAACGDDEKPEKKAGPELVLGKDGKPLEYVEYGGDNTDRNHDGTDDGFTDVNNNDIDDSDELWDQTEQKFVTPQDASGTDELEGASAQDLADIAELEPVLGNSSSRPYWREDFIKLDPLVKKRVMVALRHPEDYDTEDSWRADIIYQFTRTPEEIQD